MKIKILTIPFDDNSEGFNDEPVNKFCLNKRVHKIETEFFYGNNKIYWTVAVIYDEVVKPSEKIKEPLSNSQKLLLKRLKEWRKQKAQKEGFPVFLVTNNAQLEQIIKEKCVTLEHLKTIKGIGKSKIDKYGKEITEIVKNFYEQNN